MATKPRAGTGRALVPSDRVRAGIVRRLRGNVGPMTTAVTVAMDTRLAWFHRLGAQERSWIALVARAGIDNFASWFADDTDPAVDPLSIFDAAPRSMTRQITLQQTVDLIRTTIDVVEEQLAALMPKPDRAPLQTAIVHYSREVAFAAAEVYAGQAESRSAWDERVEAILVDAVVRDEVDGEMLSRAATLGWPTQAPTCALAGASAPERLRDAARRAGVSALCALQGDQLLALLTGPALVDPLSALGLAERLQDAFGPGVIVVGSVVPGLVAAPASAQEALAGLAAAPGWPEGPRVRSARQLLPERALQGDARAKAALVDQVYRPLIQAGCDLLETCVAFLDHTGSVEATARALYVHANTVRYRIKRIDEVSGYSPNDPRDALVLRLAITLGRQADPDRPPA